MTLTEFLEQRIAEDEAEIAYTPIEIWPSRTRVLAECAAKRRIIEHAQRIDSTGLDGAALAHDQGLRDGFTFALRYLAQPYRDHPDFDPSWRVVHA